MYWESLRGWRFCGKGDGVLYQGVREWVVATRIHEFRTSCFLVCPVLDNWPSIFILLGLPYKIKPAHFMWNQLAYLRFKCCHSLLYAPNKGHATLIMSGNSTTSFGIKIESTLWNWKLAKTRYSIPIPRLGIELPNIASVTIAQLIKRHNITQWGEKKEDLNFL